MPPPGVGGYPADDINRTGFLGAADGMVVAAIWPRKSPCRGLPWASGPGEYQSCGMQLFLRDPSYTERLAAFMTSVGRHAVVTAPDRVEVEEHDDDLQRLEVEMYLRVWAVIHPDADVELAMG